MVEDKTHANADVVMFYLKPILSDFRNTSDNIPIFGDRGPVSLERIHMWRERPEDQHDSAYPLLPGQKSVNWITLSDVGNASSVYEDFFNNIRKYRWNQWKENYWFVNHGKSNKVRRTRVQYADWYGKLHNFYAIPFGNQHD